MGEDSQMLQAPAWTPGKRPAEGEVTEEPKKAKAKEEEDNLVKQLNGKDLITMVTIMAKLLLQNSQTIRDIAGVVWYTFILSANTDFVKRIQEMGVKYAETVKGLGGGHTMGAPHVHKWLTAVEQLLVHDKIKEDKKLHKQVEVYHQEFLAKKKMEEVSASVRFFKVKAIFKGKGKQENEVKIHIALEDHLLKTEEFEEGEQVGKIFVKAFLAIGMVQKLGPGPPGQMERLVQQWIEKTKKK